ncbi:agenet domain-containing protein [Tanacetum coccineum]
MRLSLGIRNLRVFVMRTQKFSSPYTPEQNGVAEWKNRTLIESPRTMLNDSVLSKHFWTQVDTPLSLKPPESLTLGDNKVGQKVEISFEENRLCGAWFPADVVEDLGGNFLLVEYKCAGINGGEKLRRVSVDHHHIRPSSPKFKDTSFGLFDKVEAFFDFGWWSGVVTKNLADSRYIVYFKNTNKVKELGRRELRPHAEWKEDKWLTPYEVFVSDDGDDVENGFKHSEPSSVNCSTEARSALSNLTDPTKDTTLDTDKETCCTTEERAVLSVNSTETMKREKSVGRRSIEKNAKPPKKLKVTVTSDDQSPSEAGQSKEVSDTLVSPSGRVEKADVGGKISEATKSTDDQRPSDAGQSKEVSNTSISPSGRFEKANVGGKTSGAIKSTDDQSPSDVGQSKETSNTPVSPSVLVEKDNVGGKTSEVTKSTDDQSPPDAGQSKEVSNAPVTIEVKKANVGGKTGEATKSSDDQTPLDAGQSKEASNTLVSPSGRAKKAKAGGETSEATKSSDDQTPLDAGQSKEASKAPVSASGRTKKAKAGGETSEATKNLSDDQSPSGMGQSKEASKAPVSASGRPKKAKAGGETSEATKSLSDDQIPSGVGQSKEANNTLVSPSGRAKKAKAGGETSEATKNPSDDQSPSGAGKIKEANNTPVYPSGRLKRAKAGGETGEATKNLSDDQSPLGVGQSKEANNTPVGPSGRAKKAKVGGGTSEATKNLSDDQSPLGAGQNKEANNTPVYPSGRLKRAKAGGKTSEAAKSISNGRKTPGKRVKAVGLKSAGIKSARKTGEISAEGAEGDSTKITTPNIVEEQQVTQNWPFSVVMGLQCKAVTLLQSKKAESPQSFTPLSPKTTGNQEETGANADTTLKRKRGRPFKVKKRGKLPKTPSAVAVTNESGDATPGAVNGDNTLNRGAERELALMQDAFKTVKGKRGKRRSIIGLEIEAAGQGSQDSSVQRANGDLVENSTRQNSELPVETISDDQPLSRWLGIQSSATVDNTGKKLVENSNSSLAVANGDGETLSFEKRLSFWTVIESMEVFRIIPQNPHFRPLNNLKRSAREVEAINKMITFSCVAENISRLRSTSPKSDIEDHLKSLSELETHGFDVKTLKNRLTDMLSVKNKLDAAETKHKASKVSTEEKSAGLQTFEEELRTIDKQMSELLAKRDMALSKKMKEDADAAELKAKHKEYEEALHEISRQFDELAAAPLWQ